MAGHWATRPLPALGLSCAAGLGGALAIYLALPASWFLRNSLALAGVVGLVAAIVTHATLRTAAPAAVPADPKPEPPPAGRIIHVHCRSVFFVGREKQLEELHEALKDAGRAAIGSALRTGAVLSGIGGIGKTELAAQYAHRHAADYEALIGLQADSAEDLANAIIARVGGQMGVPETVYRDEQTSVAQARAVLDSAQVQGKKLLLIYDNVRDMNDVSDLLPRPPACAIVTTRLDVRPPGWSRLDVDILELPDAVDLLRGLLGSGCVDKQRRAAEQLCEALLGHPLALELAAGWLNHVEGRKRNIMALVRSLWEKGITSEALKLEEHERAEHAERGLNECFEASWLDLSERGRMALMTASCFAPWDIPVAGIVAALMRPEMGQTEDAAREAVAECLQLSLLKGSANDDGRCHFHPLLHDYARHKREALPEGRAVKAAFARHFVDFSRGVKVTNWREGQPDIPHLSEAATLAPQVIDDEDVIWPHTGLGRFYEYTGAYDRAREWYITAVHVAADKFGTQHTQYATCLNNLAGVLRVQGDLPGARESFERALEIDEAANGPDHPNVATFLNNLAGVLQDQGDLPGARERFERALEIDEAAYGPDHPTVAIRLNNLADVLKEQGDDLTGARERFERALEIDMAAYGPDHPGVARDLNNLAGVLQVQGDLAGARKRFERALEIDMAAYGPDHPNVAICLNNLAGVLHDQRDPAGARDRYERALAILEMALPADHPKVRIVRKSLEALDHDAGTG